MTQPNVIRYQSVTKIFKEVEDGSRTIFPGDGFIDFRRGPKFLIENTDIQHVPIDVVEDRIERFISDKNKFFIFFTQSFYHFWHDQVVEILLVNKEYPDTHFIIDIGLLRFSNDSHQTITPKMLEFVLINLMRLGITFDIIDSRYIDGVIANNVCITNYPSTTDKARDNGPEVLFEFAKHFIKDLEEKPYRNAYVVRGGLDDGWAPLYPDEEAQRYSRSQLPKSQHHDRRIDEAKPLEELFASLGFDIVDPSRDFDSFEEQIDYFSTVKLLVSLTSSGLTNSCFMKPGQTVIEISTPITYLVGEGEPLAVQQQIDHIFLTIAFNKNHLHVSIPNNDKDHKKIIEYLMSNTVLNNMITETGGL